MTALVNSFRFGAYDPDAQAYFNAMPVQPTDERKLLINQLIVGLKVDGIWAKLDWLVLMASHDVGAYRINAVNPAKSMQAISNNGSAVTGAFTVDKGFNANAGRQQILSMGEKIYAGGKYTSEGLSGHVGAWVQYNAPDTTLAIFGKPGSQQVELYRSGGTTYYFINASSSNRQAGTTSVANYPLANHYAANRADTNNIRLFIAGANISNNAVNRAPPAPGNYAVGVSSTANAYSDGTFAAFHSGASLTVSEHAALYNRLKTYLVDGVGIYKDPDVEALVARMSPAPTAARKTAIFNLITKLKSAGVWDQLDVFYMMAAHSEQAARLNWKSTQYTLVSNGATQFQIDYGFRLVNQSNPSWLSSGFSPSSGSKFTAQQGHMATYPLNDGNQNGGRDCGYDEGNYLQLQGTYTYMDGYLHGSTYGNRNNISSGSNPAMALVTRESLGSSAFGYRSGSAGFGGGGDGNGASGFLPGGTFVILAGRGTSGPFSSDRWNAMASTGGHISNPSGYWSAVREYLTTLGVADDGPGNEF